MPCKWPAREEMEALISAPAPRIKEESDETSLLGRIVGRGKTGIGMSTDSLESRGRGLGHGRKARE
jgi:hypothetical protein